MRSASIATSPSDSSVSHYSTQQFIVSFHGMQFYLTVIQYRCARATPVTRQTGLMSGHHPSKVTIIEFFQLRFNSYCATVLFPLQRTKLKSIAQSELSHEEARCSILRKWHVIQIYRVGWLVTRLASIGILVHASRVLASAHAY